MVKYTYMLNLQLLKETPLFILKKLPTSIIQYIYDLTMNFYNNADEIIPRLWLGNHKSALDASFLKKNNINVIINCTKNKCFIDKRQETILNIDSDNIEMYRIPVNDSLLECDFIIMQAYFKIIVPLLLRKYTIEQKNILIHCHMGKQRSAIVVAALLKVLLDYNYIKIDTIPKEDVSLEKQFNYICKYIVSKRPQAFTFGYKINFTLSFFRFFK